jgi:transposase
VDPERLVFVDESSTNIALTPRYGRAPKGERAFGKAPRNWGKNVTLISSITLEGMGPSMSIQGSSDTESFSLYMREILAPSLKGGQIVLMDNLSVHKAGWVRDLIEGKGTSSGRRRRGRWKPCSRSPLGRSRRSARRTPEASSRTAATGHFGATHYENCSRACLLRELRRPMLVGQSPPEPEGVRIRGD